VPQALIRRFTGSNGNIAIFDALEDNAFLTDPTNAFVHRDYHSVFTWDGPEDRNTLENIIMEVETFGLEGVSTLVEERRFDEEIRARLATLWSLQLVRTPPVREGAEAVIKGQLKNVLRRLDKRRMFGAVPDALRPFGETLSELVENGTVGINLLPQVSLLSLAAFDAILDVLLGMNWTILLSDEHDFCLSDNPCAIYDPEYGGSRGMSLVAPGAELSFPVAKNVCLVATRYLPHGSFFESRRAIAYEINRRTAIFGQRFFGFPVINQVMNDFFKKYAVGYPVAVVEQIETENDGRLKVWTLFKRGFSSAGIERLYVANCRPLSALIG
jgi:hypothetical protein